MKVLVFSDAHGTTSGMETAIELHPDARHILFLGDGVRQVENLSYCYPDITFTLLSGNCDFSSEHPCEKTLTIGGVRLFACHGHTLMVKSGLGSAISRAVAEGAKVLLYGHTHVPYCEYRDGIYLLNPGSIGQPRSSSKREYGLLEISEKGILPSLATL